MVLSRYNDLVLEKCVYDDTIDINHDGYNVEYDYFDQYVITGNIPEIYKIIVSNVYIGYVTLYNFDYINSSVCIYGKIKNNEYFGVEIKALLSVMDDVFSQRKLNKIYLVYREDNYFYDNVCKCLCFIKEGTLRNHIIKDKYTNLNINGMLANEYFRNYMSKYRKMFTWDHSYTPKNYVVIDIERLLNCRSFTNSLDNYNKALMNDQLNEFALNKKINIGNYLEYKDIKFPVYIFDTEMKYDSLICQGQIIELIDNRYCELLLIVTAQFGYKESCITLTYTNEEEEDIALTVSDWCEYILRDEYIIHNAYGCREIEERSNIVKGDSFLYLKKINLKNKDVKQIRLPNNRDIFVYAIALTME